MNDLLDGMRLQTDHPADELVRRIVSETGPEEAKRLFTVLIRNVDIPFAEVPDYIRDFMEIQGRVPAWVDSSRVLRGQKVFVDYGIYFVLFLYVKSLPTCYLDWRGAQVLHLTGRLDQGRGYPEIYARRIAETAQFVLDVMNPGSMVDDGKGVQTLLKIRLIHASIRHFIGRDPRWEEAAWQKPINQEDMALTLMTFSVTMVEAMEQLGKAIPEEEAEDFYYTWRVVGEMMGIRPALIPDSVAGAQQLKNQILARQAGPSVEGAALTQALIDFAEDLNGVKIMDKVIPSLIAFFMEGRYAEMLGVVEGKGCLGKFLPGLLSRSIGLAERLEDKGLPLSMFINQVGMGIIHGMVNRMDKYKNRHFQVPPVMQEAWGMGGR